MPKSIPILFLAAFLVGCGDPGLQAPAEPAQAREALCAVLEAWQRGDSLQSVRTGTPAVQVHDRDWAAGLPLARYQIVSEGERAGLDMRYRVVLTLQPPGGRAIRRNAVYMVGTSPIPTVHREYDD
jgi:hypothetical protein